MMPLKLRTTAVIHAGILIAIALIFALFSAYNPVLGIFSATLWPLPFIVLGVKHGLKACVLALLAASIIAAFWLNPLYSLSIILGFSWIAISVAYTLRRKYPLAQTLYWSITMSLLSKYLVLFVLTHILGFDPLNISQAAILKGTEKLTWLLNYSNVPHQDIQLIITELPKTLHTLNKLLPTGFVIASILDSLCNYWLAQKILVHWGIDVTALPDFEQLYMPKYLTWFFVGSAAAITYLNLNPTSIYFTLLFNIYIVSLFLLIIQAISCIFFFANRTAYPVLIKNIAVLLIFVNPLFGKIAALFAIYDIIRQLRHPNFAHGG